MPSDISDVSEQLKYLIELQEIDTRIKDIRGQKEDLPETIKKARHSLDAAESDLDKAKALNEGLLKEKKDKERAVEDEESKIQRLKSKTSEIKTNKEYQALLSEIEAAQKIKNSLEDALLEVLEKIEEAKKELLVKEQVFKEEEKKFSSEENSIKADFAKMEEELKTISKVREDKVARIDKELLKKYTQLFNSKNSLAVVAVKNGSCLGCHMNIPPQTFTEIKKSSKIIQCFNCHRIHFWKD